MELSAAWFQRSDPGSNPARVSFDALAAGAGRLTYRLADLAENSLMDALLGKQGTADGGLLGNLFKGAIGAIGGGGAAAAGALPAGTGGLYALGGFVSGPGSGTSASIPARLSNGEFVVNAAATARHRGLLEEVNSDSPIARFATGGFVGRQASSAAAASANVGDTLTFVTNVDARGSTISEGQFHAMLKENNAQLKEQFPAWYGEAKRNRRIILMLTREELRVVQLLGISPAAYAATKAAVTRRAPGLPLQSTRAGRPPEVPPHHPDRA